jgi:hypothetical protein
MPHSRQSVHYKDQPINAVLGNNRWSETRTNHQYTVWAESRSSHGNCTLLGHHAATLKDGTDRWSRNVGKELPLITRKSSVIICLASKARNEADFHIFRRWLRQSCSVQCVSVVQFREPPTCRQQDLSSAATWIVNDVSCTATAVPSVAVII